MMARTRGCLPRLAVSVVLLPTSVADALSRCTWRRRVNQFQGCQERWGVR
jgi:hypothetical protein